MLRGTLAARQWMCVAKKSPWLEQSHRFTSSGRRFPLTGVDGKQTFAKNTLCELGGTKRWTYLVPLASSSSTWTSGKTPSEEPGRRTVSSGTEPTRSALSCSECPPEPTNPYKLIGTREIVGHGMNGSPMYSDDIHYPYPAIRFREITPAYKALKEKERGDWKALTLLEKKCLYRISFCQTIAEMTAPTGEWKSIIGWGFFWLGVAILVHVLGIYSFYWEPWPETFKEERQKAQLKRMRDLGVGRIDGINQNTVYDMPDESVTC